MLENFLLSPWVLCSDILERKIENMEFSGLWGVYSFVYVIFNNFPAVLLAALIIFILANVAMEFGMKTPQNLNAVEIDKPISVPEKGEKKASNKSLKKKGGAERWSKDNLRNSFAHDWLLTSLKGHKGPILDMDFSSNGKYLATCAQDDCGGMSGSSSGSEGNKENNSSSSNGLSRRQKKNSRGRNISPDAKKKMKKPSHHLVSKQFLRLGLSETDLFFLVKIYVLKFQDLVNFGYPVESRLYPGQALIFKVENISFNPNAKEFYPRSECSSESGITTNFEHHEVDSSYEFVESPLQSTSETPLNKTEDCSNLKKKCVRCGRSFFLAEGGNYLTHEHCLYHWGKLEKSLNGSTETVYSCCKGQIFSVGCTTGKLHVWSGLNTGKNGPLDGYVCTKSRKNPPRDGNYGMYGVDCEMCYTTLGLELTRVTVVGSDGRLVYDTYVRPENDIIDYNTRFSGITAKDLSKKACTKSLREVQNDLMGFISADTILVGHGLENDLRALRIIHPTVIDTAVVFPHFRGMPYRRSLKSLIASILKRDIQTNASGHDSFEDARSCVELMLWKIRKDKKLELAG